MDRLPAHKLAKIEPLIQAVGASVLNLSPHILHQSGETPKLRMIGVKDDTEPLKCFQ
jgi:hypothetical protein